MNEPEHSPQTIFLTALEIEDPEQRAIFIAQSCGADQALREEVEELLQAQAAAGQFLPKKTLAQGAPAALLASVCRLGHSATTLHAPVTEKPGDWIGRYKLLQKIGEGGCGVVYVAEQEEPVRRQVALKVIKLGMDTRQVVARFEAERQALALMDHPSIAKVFDAGATEAGRPFFVMELVRGVRITDYCDKNGLPTGTRLELFIKVCQAIQHAHQKGVIHRDIKPSNILVTVDDGVAVPKVIDFGIAKATEGRLTGLTLVTAFEQFLGTPAYMSPEQAGLTSADVDTRSDIYSLGVLLYELLTGMTPFDTKALLAAGLDELRRTIREQEPLRPSTRLSAKLTTLSKSTKPPEAREDSAQTASVGPQNGSSHLMAETKALIKTVRGDLDWIVMKCLEKDRARRYETASGLAKDIERHLNYEPVVARPPSKFYEFGRTVRRHKLGFATAAIIMLTLAAGVLVSTWQAVQKNRERQHLKDNVIRLYVANGARLVSAGDLFGSLPWYAEALRLDAGDPVREKPHRVRIASILRQCPKLLSVISHGDMLYHAGFSPNGSNVLTASDDHTARVWDANSGGQLLLLAHDDQVYDARYGKTGMFIITASRDRTAKVWNSQTGQLVRSLNHPQSVLHGRLSPDGTLAATICMDNSARLWDVATGELAAKPLPHRGALQQMAFSPDGRLLITLSSGMLHVWEVPSGRLLFQCPHMADSENDLDGIFSPDSKSFISYDASAVHVWDATTFRERPDSRGAGLFKMQTWCLDLAIDSTGTSIVTTGQNGTAQVWDFNTGRPLFTPPVQHAGVVGAGRISPDGRLFATAGADAIARVWTTSTGKPASPPLKTIIYALHLDFNADGRRLLVKSCDQAARVWDLATSDLTDLPLPPFHTAPSLISPDGFSVLQRDSSNTIWVADAVSGHRRVGLHHSHRVVFCCFSGDGKTVLTAEEEVNRISDMRNDIFLWDAATGQRRNSNSMTHAFTLLYAAFSPDNRRLLTCGLDASARLWDAQTGRPISGLLPHGQPVSWGAFSPDGASVVTISRDNCARVWDGFTGVPLTPSLQHKSAVADAFWSPDCKRLCTLTFDSRRQDWDLATGLPLTPPTRIRDLDAISPPGMPSVWDDGDMSSEGRPLKDLVLLSQMLAVGRIDAAGNAVPLGLQELTNNWKILRQKYPEQFCASSSQVAEWHLQAAIESENDRNLKATLFHLDGALAAKPLDPFLTQQRSEVAAALTQRSNHLTHILSPLPPPLPRDQRATKKQIDLTSFYNAELGWPRGGDFGTLVEGLQTLGGVQFDVRGTIQLNSQVAQQHGSASPERVTGIPIAQKFQRLHFLHATGWDEEPGTTVGTYALHYADGEVRELPIRFRGDIGNYWGNYMPVTRPGDARVVWNGSNPRAAAMGFPRWLFKSTRENPRPDVEVTSVDFVSNMTDAAPFLIALTVE